MFLSCNGQTKIYGCFVNGTTDVALKIFHRFLIGRGTYDYRVGVLVRRQVCKGEPKLRSRPSWLTVHEEAMALL
jgi:hypothetical protein